MSHRVTRFSKYSAAACGALTALWAVSHFGTVVVISGGGHRSVEVGLIRDSFYFGSTTDGPGAPGRRRPLRVEFGPVESPAMWMLDGSTHGAYGNRNFEIGCGGFSLISTAEPVQTLRRAMIPLWFCWAATFTVPVIVWSKRRRDRRRTADDLCPGCGYDLRASINRCPECGRSISNSRDRPAALGRP